LQLSGTYLNKTNKLKKRKKGWGIEPDQLGSTGGKPSLVTESAECGSARLSRSTRRDITYNYSYCKLAQALPEAPSGASPL
jgi:hypothetical protein